MHKSADTLRGSLATAINNISKDTVRKETAMRILLPLLNCHAHPAAFAHDS